MQFVPTLFAQWAPMVCDAAEITAGQQVLDVACGTGIVARAAADRAGPGNVIGVDLNDAMLTVARRVRPDITWRQGDASALPFPDGTFDAVVCQMALMFFPDRARALREDGPSRSSRRHGCGAGAEPPPGAAGVRPVRRDGGRRRRA